VSIYISHSNLQIYGSLLLKDNKAGEIQLQGDTANVNFISKTATTDGGAIYQIHLNILFGTTTILTLDNNTADCYGDAVFSDNSNFNGSPVL